MIYPKISIIIATYNVGQTLESAIRSVLYQTYSNVELIIVDGGSTDNTLEIVNKYKADFGEKMRFISEKDKGIYDAWNKGIVMASGEWVTFLGGDDYLVQDFCMNYYDVIVIKPNLNFISAINLLVTEEDNPIRFYGKPINKDFVKYCTIAHVGSLHHKSLFESFGIYNIDFLIAGDYDFLLRVRKKIISFFLPKLGVIVRDGGISNKKIINVFVEQMNAKINNKARNSILCKYDFCIAYLKYIIRKRVTFFL
jgi:glycosyltransferase involved in cell wall biosynthesis